jgi:hypothetical protein
VAVEDRLDTLAGELAAIRTDQAPSAPRDDLSMDQERLGLSE